MNVEKELCAFLAAETGEMVVADVPAKRPERLISLERTGGGIDDVIIGRPTIAFQCWEKSRVEASEFALQIVSVLTNAELVAEKLPAIDYISIERIYNFPDVESGQPRYQIVAEIAATG
jgi:hypothetical protein